jgi:phosphoribosyl-dephospho-CoA transferase
MAAREYRPHDLLWARLPDRFDAGGTWPEWLDAAWLVEAPLVVRREAGTGSRVPVGARGSRRSQRCMGYVQGPAVARRVTPEMLARSVRPGPGRARRALHPAGALRVDPGALAQAARLSFACIETLLAVAPQLDALGLEWGPAGGAGFFLASGLPVLRPDSDLDLLVRAAARPDWRTLDALGALQAGAPCRIDIQVDTGQGGFALAEYLQGARRTMLKTAHGPVLLPDPWDYRQAA